MLASKNACVEEEEEKNARLPDKSREKRTASRAHSLARVFLAKDFFPLLNNKLE